LTSAIEAAGHTGKVKFAIDAAADGFFKNNKYHVGFDPNGNNNNNNENNTLSPGGLQDFYRDLRKKYPIILIEDPFAEDDWDSWTQFQKTWPVELVGDDLLATNIERMQEAKDRAACNSLLLKMNQIGTVSETIQAYVRTGPF
jgi:enolase